MSGNKNRGDGELRQSQLITTFGVGAMVDLPANSVIISGLSYWQGQRQPLWEERLQRKISQILKVDQIKLYTPPRESQSDFSNSYINAFIFPTWFLGQVDETVSRHGKEYRTRPLVKWSAIKGGKVKFEGKSVPVVPIRFVQGCVNGHLSDINWYAYVHQSQDNNCHGQLWLDEGGSGNDFEEIFVRCEACKKSRALAQAKLPNSKVLGLCQGHRPWLGPKGQETCIAYKLDESGELVATEKPENNRLLVRSASNAYFSQTLSVISLPDPDAQLKKAIDRFYEEDLQYLEDISELRLELRKPKFADLAAFEFPQIWEEIQQRKNGQRSAEKSIKQVELEALLSVSENGQTLSNFNTQDFDARLRPQDTIPDKWQPIINRIVLVHRLREVIAQVGFTRFDAYLPNIEGELEDLGLNVRLAALDFEKNWVPALENKGEGVFISFHKSLIEQWCNRPPVKARAKILIEGFERGLQAKGIAIDKYPFPGIPYIMLHSLSHLLITSVSLDCGYTASAIRERIYANDTGYGILLYTGTSGSEGTLGGLVEVGKRLEYYLEKALSFGQLCSNDPICAQHNPPDMQESRFFHGAACHGCLLIAETSCERRNEFLDRALVVNTVEELDAAFFSDELIS